MPFRPLVLPDWATATNYAAGPYPGNNNKAQPPAGVISEGFDPSSQPPAEWLNWLFNTQAQWLDYLSTPLQSVKLVPSTGFAAIGSSPYLLNDGLITWTNTAPTLIVPSAGFPNGSVRLQLGAASAQAAAGFAGVGGASGVAGLFFPTFDYVADFSCDMVYSNATLSPGNAIIAGFHTPASSFTNAAYLEIPSGLPNVQCVATGGGVNTVVDSGVPKDTALHNYRVVLTPGVNAKYYIDGNLVGTITTNLPVDVLTAGVIFKDLGAGSAGYCQTGTVLATWNTP